MTGHSLGNQSQALVNLQAGVPGERGPVRPGLQVAPTAAGGDLNPRANPYAGPTATGSSTYEAFSLAGAPPHLGAVPDWLTNHFANFGKCAGWLITGVVVGGAVVGWYCLRRK